MLSVLEASLETARNVTGEQRRQAREFVQKYGDVLGASGLPHINIIDRVTTHALGRTLWHPRRLGTSVMELQRSILSDKRTLERVIAHEMVHHVEVSGYTQADVTLMRMGMKKQSHGREFQRLAHIINDFVGDPEFVTERSDESYVVAASKPFYLLLYRFPNGNLGYAYGVRLTPKMQRFIERYQERGAKLLQVTDSRWAVVRIGDGRFATAIKPADREALEKMFSDVSKHDTVRWW